LASARLFPRRQVANANDVCVWRYSPAPVRRPWISATL